MVLILVLMGVSACSFNPPAYQGQSNNQSDTPADLPDVSVLDGMVKPHDMNVDSDMSKMDMSNDMKMPDMPLADQGMDMPDLPTTDRMIGDPCTTPEQCASGRCQSFGSIQICTETCTENCSTSGFVCSGSTCTPSTFCENDPAPGLGNGPGCRTCSKCDADAECVEVVEGGQTKFSCACKSGFEGDGFDCVDINECTDGSNLCDNDATCTNVDGDYTCKCTQGFEGDGFTCTKEDACAKCDVNATCTNQMCTCDIGYAGNGMSCADVNECTDGSNNCDTNATCTNTPGSFTCACASGFIGDGKTCSDDDECATGNNMCDPNAVCTNTPGSYTCMCPAGASGNGFTCQLSTSCAQIIQQFPNSPSGNYTISTSQGPLQVYCDMTSDGGVGYTMVRFDDPTLGNDQQDYHAFCANYGMEVITPRTAQHLDSIIQFNNNQPPNLVGVFPKYNNAIGKTEWTGVCGGQQCTSYINGRDTFRCKTLIGSGALNNPGRWSDGSYARSCRAYQDIAGNDTNSGVYTIDVDGGGAVAPSNVFCEMSTDGGGWTLAVVTSDDGVDTWTWNGRGLWTSNQATVGALANVFNDYKSNVIHHMPITDMFFRHAPSLIWASYHNVGNGNETTSDILSNENFPNCDPNSGYTMTNGTLTKAGKLCSTDLYFHPGDYDGGTFTRCDLISGFNNDESTYGPAWSIDNNSGCDFDDPTLASFGPRQDARNSESDSAGFGFALGLNVAPDNSGGNFMRMYIRGNRTLSPEGDNVTNESLVLLGSASDTAGPSCPTGDWDDRGNLIPKQGHVICSIN